MAQKELLSTAEAGELLGVSQRRAIQLIESGRLPATRVGKSYIVNRADLAKVRHRKPGRPAGKKKGS